MGGGLYPAYTQWCKASGVCALSKVRFLGGLERRVPGFKKKYVDRIVEGKRHKFTVIIGVALVNAEF